MNAPGPMLWRRVDPPGHDAATLRLDPTGPTLTGMTVFHDGAPTALAYSASCDRSWLSVEGRVQGWRGPEPVDLRLRRDAAGGWTLNGAPCPEVQGCEDLDLNFTPATNIFPLRRLALAVGEAAEVRSAWLEWPAARLALLVQRYHRRSPAEFDYEADLPGPTPFRAVLRVEPEGWVVDYGGLWRAEPAG